MLTHEINVHRNTRGELQAENDIELQPISDTKALIVRVSTYKARRGGVNCRAQVGVREIGRAGGFSGFSFAISIGGGGDYSAVLASEPARATENAIRRVHSAGLAALPGHLDAIRKAYGIAQAIKFDVSANGHTFGTYEAASEQEARDLCAKDAGYKSEADMAAQLGRPSELVATPAAELQAA